MKGFTMLLSRFSLLAALLLLIAARAATVLADDDQPASVLPHVNTLTAEEKAAGWQLLFDGQTTKGWRNYKKKDVSAGWQIHEGALYRVNGTAGDIVSEAKYDNFILELDYKVPAHANSGVMYRVSEDQGSPWATGIEYQLLDNTDPHGDAQKSGWAYGLYVPPTDPKTDKPRDATNAIGHWNHVKLVCDGPHVEHWMNGEKYCEFEIGSDDFNKRVKASKFGTMPRFAKNTSGHIALQGDHGNVAFATIKIKVLPAK